VGNWLGLDDAWELFLLIAEQSVTRGPRLAGCLGYSRSEAEDRSGSSPC
jgi:hypothetical protein